MRFSEQYAVESRLESIRLDVYSGNPRAINLYKHLGYRIVGQFKLPIRNLPFHCMEKPINQSAKNAEPFKGADAKGRAAQFNR